MQTEIQWYMRPYIVDFLIEAHQAFNLLPETLFLTINILDRYCSKRVVYRRHFQLVGCTALWIACKYGECPRAVPQLRELCNMCCQLYDEDMFLQMERHMMATLDWYIGASTVDGFIKLALDGLSQDTELESMAFYISEMAAFHRDFVSIRPSDIAKAAIYLAQIIGHRPALSPCHWASTHHQQVVLALSQLLSRPSDVLFNKYNTEPKRYASATVHTFLEQHSAAAQAHAAPPTPPAAPPPAEKDCWQSQGPYATPVKNQHLVHAPNGVPTPPITPDSENFLGKQQPMGPGPAAAPPPPPQCPATPMPTPPVQPSNLFRASFFNGAVQASMG